MRLLFDQNLSFKLCRELAEFFPESSQARLLGLEEADDRDLWNAAGAGGFILVSLDADFAEMVQLRGPPPKVIWLRCGNQPTRYVADPLRRNAGLIATLAEDAAMDCLELY